MYRSLRHWSDRVKELDLPLFPGYIFCRFDPLHRLPILTSPGIVSIVGLGKNPEPVDDAEITRIQMIVKSGVLACPCPFLRAGEKIAVTRGPLTGVEGFLVSSKNQFRLVVSIQLLQRSVATEIDRDCVEPISSAASVLASAYNYCIPLAELHRTGRGGFEQARKGSPAGG
jgi:transcription antitermination factor NusG